MAYSLDDILLKRQVELQGDPVEAFRMGSVCDASTATGSLFFPGCSLLNFAPQIMLEAFGLLQKLGQADCITGVCCGRILESEPLEADMVKAYKGDLAASLAKAGIIRVVCACPNCLQVLEAALAGSDIQLVALPQVLADAGIRIQPDEGIPVFTVHDSCSDRITGRYATSVRTLLENCQLVEMAHNRQRSLCCGSSIRAAGRGEDAIAFAYRRSEEAKAAGAGQVITACMSCSSFIGTLAGYPTHHYLELLFRRPINWNTMPAHVRGRLLLHSLPGTRRHFVTPDA